MTSGPRHFLIYFNGPPNQVPVVAIGRAKPILTNNVWAFKDEHFVGSGFVGPATVSAAEKARGKYVFASDSVSSIDSDGLVPGATYHYIITIPGAAGRQPHQDTGHFIMRQETTTVKVVWESVKVEDDSDAATTGELTMWFWANHGQPSAKAAEEYYNRDADSGRTYNIRRIVVVENASNTLTLAASGRENDGAFQDATPNPPPVTAPNDSGRLVAGGLGRYSGYTVNVANGAFDLTKYPGNNPAAVPFRLNSMPNGGDKGDLRFVVFGHFEITRGTAPPGSSGGSENTGTTSSALKTIPVPPQFIGTFSKSPPNYQPMWVYAIKNDGTLLWYRKDSGASAWQGPRQVGSSWNFKDVIAAGGNSLYALTEDGKLLWYQHNGFNDGSFDWKGPVEIGTGWTYKKIFAGGDGIVYAITQDGKLVWHRHGGWANGGGPETWTGPLEVGSEWSNHKDVFSTGQGAVFAVTAEGKLMYNLQKDYANGSKEWGRTREVGPGGWHEYRQIVPAGDGVILGIKNDGTLVWHRRSFIKPAIAIGRVKEQWEGPLEIGTGWQGFLKVMALIPASAAALPVVR